MALFDEVFNKASIYDMLFFNVKAVLIHPTLDELKVANPALFERWKYIQKSKLGSVDGISEDYYTEKAIYYPEFSRIVAITYASLYSDNGTLKRSFKKIVNEDEYIVIATFMDVLHLLSGDGIKSTPQFFPMLCGHNIINYDIPVLIKRFILHRDKFETNKQLPLLVKKSLNAKPWESSVIDTVSVWKFNGNDYTPLMLIANYLGLKKTVDLNTLSEVSEKYWEMVGENPTEALEYVSLQSATQTNLVIQLINELRQL